MDSRRNQDRISTLPGYLLVLIISKLPFQEAVRTSLLSKPWKHLHQETTNVSFKESEFVKRSASSSEESIRDARVSFVRFMVDWVTRFPGNVVQSFELCLSKPFEFEAEIKHVIEFAVSKQVKNLVLDFSDLSCSASNQARPAVAFQLPQCVYGQATIESLKLFGCGFDPSRFANQCSFKSLSFGYIQLGEIIMTLLSKSPLLESLIIRNCWNVGLESITGDNSRLRELIFENCDFATDYSLLDLPNIQIFKYCGTFHYFQFVRVNRRMEEAYLDFRGTEVDRDIGILLRRLLYDLLSANKLTVCPYLINVVISEDPVNLEAPMETRHLVIKTNLVPAEFEGIRLMIKNCPELETLTLQLLPPLVPVPRTRPESYWKYPLSHECLKKTLKVVEVRDYRGGAYEFSLLRYLIRTGRVLETMEIYLPVGIAVGEKASARASINTLGEEGVASQRLRIRVHNVGTNI